MTTVPTPADQLLDIGAARHEQYRDALAASSHLSAMLAAAGVPGRARLTESNEALAITLPPLDIRQASRVAALIRQDLAEFFVTADALSAVGEERGIPLSVTVEHSRLQITDLTVHDADRLTSLLGRSGPSDVDPDDLDDPQAAEAVVDRLKGAIEDATGVTPGADITHACFCQRCGHGVTVRLLPITVQTAEQLLRALTTK